MESAIKLSESAEYMDKIKNAKKS